MYILIFSLLTLITEIIGTIGGFGSSVFFVPLASCFFPFTMVLALTGILHIFSNLAKLILFYKHIHYKIFLLSGLPAILSVFGGAMLITRSPIQYATLALGIFLAAGSLFLCIKKDFKINPIPINIVSGGIISGFLAGFTGTGGPIRAIALSAYQLNKNTFVATSCAIDMGIDLTRTLIYIEAGFFVKSNYELIPILALTAFWGSWLGKKIIDKTSDERFKKIVLILIFLIGMSQIIKNII